MKKRISKIFIVLILFISFVMINIKSYASNISNDLKENIFRLHIIANSDSKEDQELKLKVRDNIISYIEELTKNCKTKSDVIEIVQNHTKELENIASHTIKQNGYNYEINLEIGEYYFPTKYYGNVSMPAGSYDALRIKIGNGSGQNWWCSLFPPLCFTDISSGIIDEEAKTNLKENLDNEDYSIITSTSSSYKFKFKLIEILNTKNIL